MCLKVHAILLERLLGAMHALSQMRVLTITATAAVIPKGAGCNRG